MTVSIITVCFNSGQTIADTLQSIRDQDYPFIESVVVDGGSTDNTMAIVQRYADVVTTSISEPDKGIYDAMNKGLAMAKGDVIGILNSDDLLADTQSISRVVQAFSHQACDCVYADLVYVDQTDTNKVVRYWKSGKGTAKDFYYGWMPPHPTFYVSRRVLEQCGKYDLRFPVASDYEYMLRLIVKHQLTVSYIPQIVLVKMRMGGYSNHSVNNRKRSFFENHEAWRVNGLKPYFFTVWFKIARKFKQYLAKP